MKIYIRDIFTSHFVINSLSNSSVHSKLIPPEVLSNPEKMHRIVLHSVRWPASTSYNQLIAEWKTLFTMSLHNSLSSEEKQLLTNKAIRAALLRYSNLLVIDEGSNSTTKIKIAKESIICDINENPSSVEKVKISLRSLVEKDFVSITKQKFDLWYDLVVPNKQITPRKKTRSNWSVKEEDYFQKVFQSSKQENGKYNYKHIVDKLRPYVSRTDDQIKWKVAWTIEKERKRLEYATENLEAPVLGKRNSFDSAVEKHLVLHKKTKIVTLTP